MRTLYRMLKYLRPYWRQFLLSFVALLISTAVNLIIPRLFGRNLIDEILTRDKSIAMLNLLAGAIILLFLVKGIASYGQGYLNSYVGQRLIMDLRNQIFGHLQKLSLAFHETVRTGELIARATNDVALVQMGFPIRLMDLLQQSLMLTGALFSIFSIHWKLASLMIIVLPVLGLVVNRFGARIRQLTRMVQEKIADLTSILQETLAGIRIVKAFGMEKHEARRFAEENDANFQVTMKSAQLSATLTPFLELLSAFGMTVVIWYGGLEVIRGHLSIGKLIEFFTYLGLAAQPISNLGGSFANLQQSLAAGDRIFSLLDIEADIDDAPDAVELPRLSGRVSFKNVEFAYHPGKPVLQDIDLEVAPGEVIAVVGPSGAGKSTLVNLIPRFYDVAAGAVEVDGYDVRRVKGASLRKQIGLVPQETILFGAGVAENIAYGRRKATRDEVIAAARAANAHEFIMALPQGYDTLVGERGVGLSGGQRQRIAIARAVLRNPRILILDEATSALDAESEMLVQEALRRLMEGRTTFIIAHRLSSIKHADRIVVLEKGRIVEIGSHSQLMAQEGLYRRLYERQLETEEVSSQ
ncbi:MAG: ABC transporter ATP-binding protein/permease [Firmicutes bacterium]|nr:ABC transporter ATP-binding protein/permease [Bacillota bacterium]